MYKGWVQPEGASGFTEEKSALPVQGAFAQEKQRGQGLVEKGEEQGQGWLRERVLVKRQREELGSAKQWGWGGKRWDPAIASSSTLI